MGWGYFIARDYVGAARRLKSWIVGTGEAEEHAVAVERLRTSTTDRSGSIAVAALAQALMPTATARRRIAIQNLSSGELWVSVGGTAAAAAGSLRIPVGGYYESPEDVDVTGAVSIFGAAAGQAFTAKEW